MLERSRARRQALQILYQREVTGIPVGRILADRSYIADADGEPGDFCRVLAEGTEVRLGELDERLGRVSENWSEARMPLVDKNILRMAVFELLYLDEVPASVTINEAVELAKTYGGDDSSKFVNGVLGRIAEQQQTLTEATESEEGDG